MDDSSHKRDDKILRQSSSDHDFSRSPKDIHRIMTYQNTSQIANVAARTSPKARDGHHFGWRQVPPRIIFLGVQLQLIVLLSGGRAGPWHVRFFLDYLVYKQVMFAPQTLTNSSYHVYCKIPASLMPSQTSCKVLMPIIW